MSCIHTNFVDMHKESVVYTNCAHIKFVDMYKKAYILPTNQSRRVGGNNSHLFYLITSWHPLHIMWDVTTW